MGNNIFFPALINFTFALVQKLVAFLLSIIFLVQSFNQYFCYLDYIVRRADYEKRCVNKAFPQMHCNGQCQLMKKIREQEKANQGQPPEIKFAAKVEVLPAAIYLDPLFFCKVRSHKYSNLELAKLSLVAFSIFHPPPTALFA